MDRSVSPSVEKALDRPVAEPESAWVVFDVMRGRGVTAIM
jgi:hypothetical protein